MAQVGRRAFVALALIAVSAAMVYGTWLAVDDMRAKPLVARVTRAGEVIHVANTSSYAWEGARFTVNGRYLLALTSPVEPFGAVVVPLRILRAENGDVMPERERALEVTVAVTRRPRFPRVNRARTASGTFYLE